MPDHPSHDARPAAPEGELARALADLAVLRRARSDLTVVMRQVTAAPLEESTLSLMRSWLDTHSVAALAAQQRLMAALGPW